jgi:hypothetical protein
LDPDEPDEPDESDEPAIVVVFVRFKVSVPKSECWSRVALASEDPGFVVPNAQMSFWLLSLFAGTEKTNLGLASVVEVLRLF